MTDRKRILFICTHNAGRSQMAEALVNRRLAGSYRAFSAGTEPSTVNPHVRRAMAEMGMDMAGHRSKSVDEFRGQSFDFIVTLCDQAAEACPFFPGGGLRMHRGFPDPSRCLGDEDEVMACVRRIRDAVEAWVEEAFGPAGSSAAGSG